MRHQPYSVEEVSAQDTSVLSGQGSVSSSLAAVIARTKALASPSPHPLSSRPPSDYCFEPTPAGGGGGAARSSSSRGVGAPQPPQQLPQRWQQQQQQQQQQVWVGAEEGEEGEGEALGDTMEIERAIDELGGGGEGGAWRQGQLFQQQQQQQQQARQRVGGVLAALNGAQGKLMARAGLAKAEAEGAGGGRVSVADLSRAQRMLT